MDITENDILSFKLFKIIRDVGSRTLLCVLHSLYHEHPFSKKGSVSAKDFCRAVQNFYLRKRVYGSIFEKDIQALNDNYKFEFTGTESKKFDISSLFLILTEMALVMKSSDTLKTEKDKKQKQKGLANCDIEALENCILKTEQLEQFRDKFENVLHEVKGIKDIRNELCHMKELDWNVLHSLKDDFDNCLTDLYTEMDKILQEAKYLTLRDMDRKDTRNIWDTNLRKDEEISLHHELKENDVKKFISLSKEELIRKYKCFEILIPSFLSQEVFRDLYLNDIFTPVELFTKKKSLDYHSILTCNSEKKTTSPPAVVISGNAGLGKTTICRKMTNDWCQGTLNTKKNSCHFDLLLHIEAKKAKESSLAHYLKSVLLPETQKALKFQSDHIIPYLTQCNILFIIDGYDEKSANASKMLDEIMFFFPNKKFIISTRPYYLKQIFNSLKQNNIMYLDVNVLGFRKENRSKFVDNVWCKIKNTEIDSAAVQKFKKYLENDIGDNLGELLNIPLVVLIILYLFISGKNTYKSIRNITFTNLYSEIFDLIKKKVIDAITEHCDETSKASTERNLEIFMIDLASECFRLIALNNESSIDRLLVKNIRKKIADCFESCSSVHFESIYTSFFMFNPSVQRQSVLKMSDAQLADHLEFLHKTQIEYLAAFYIFNKMSSPDFDIRILDLLFDGPSTNQEKDIESVFGVTSYLIGLLSKNTNLLKRHIEYITSSLSKKLIDYKYKFVICWKILYETKKYNDNEELCEFYYDKNISKMFLNILPEKKWELCGYEVVSGLKLLAYSDIRIEKLEVNISESMCANEISNFIPTIWEMKSLMSMRYKDNFLPSVEINFNGDLLKGTIPNDEIIKSFCSWGHLEKFTGLLGEKAFEALQYCYKVKILHVRFLTKKALHDCVKALADKKGLKRFYLYIHIDQGESFDGYVQRNVHINQGGSSDGYVPLNVFKQVNVSVLFEGVVKENISDVSEILVKLKPKEQLFHNVSLLRTNLTYLDVEVLYPAIKKLVSKKFEVHSTKDANEMELLEINNSLNCVFSWLS